MEHNTSYLPISLAQLNEFSDKVNAVLKSVKWRPKPGVIDATPTPVTQWRESGVARSAEAEIKLLTLAHQLNGNSLVLDDDINHVMNVIERALKLGMHLSALYVKFSNLESLMSQNSKGTLTGMQQTEFRDKYVTSSAVAAFVTAYYIVWELSQYKNEEITNHNLECEGVPELSLDNPAKALNCVLFYFGSHVAHSGKVRNGLDFTKMAFLYFRAVLDEIGLRKESLKHLEPFINNAYKLEGSEFSIEGFEIELDGTTSSIEFNHVSLHQIVGNVTAKHEAHRLVQRMMCYDAVRKLNPILKLGGFPRVRMGYGPPGTGKSMLIAAIATLLYEWCNNLGIPFLFWPMPDTVVSTFQGGSAERMMNWMRPLRDPSKIIYAPIDDAENNLEERSRQGISAGVREVIGVFLRNTEGAYAINHGNAVIDIFTNLPDQVDKAVLSRVRSRFIIDGAQTWQDFVDQIQLWVEQYGDDKSLINMIDPSGYKYFDAQDTGARVEAMYKSAEAITDGRIGEIVATIGNDYGYNEFAFFAKVCEAVKLQFPMFTSRDFRNIQEAIDSRMMDFDFPDIWMENPDVFFRLDYESKLSELLELRRINMGGLKFHEIFFQEMMRYFDNMIKIVDEGKRRQLNEMVERMRLENQAHSLFTKEAK